MSTTIPYRCGNDQRRRVVQNSDYNGIDYLEVTLPTTETEQPKLTIHFLKAWNDSAPPDRQQIQITGAADAVPVQVQAEPTLDETKLRLTCPVSLGDRSVYTLRLLNNPPAFDRRLAEVAFTFRIEPPATLGPQPPVVRPPAPPEINYLAKDYASFRRLMLDRLAALQPIGVDDHPADLQVALVELLAYSADRLSYYQDAVATEAYLGTARSRISLRRHARLLDYQIHEGCNARVWLQCTVDRKVQVQQQWAFSTTDDPPVIFEPCHEPWLYPQHNEINFYPWSEEAAYMLPAGATYATLLQQEPKLSLKPGDFLLLAATPEQNQPMQRHVVRLTQVTPTQDWVGPVDLVEVAWDAEDALPFALPIRQQGAVTAVAHGNMVWADHGATKTDEPLEIYQEYPAAPYQANLPAGPITRAEPLPADLQDNNPQLPLTTASRLLQRALSATLPVITVIGDGMLWQPRYDRLTSAPDAAHFVVESEHDGRVLLHFGDGLYYGRQPQAPATFQVRYRVGNGQVGNVGAAAICQVTGDGTAGVQVSNPLPASGGVEPESAEQVRRFAPQAFRRQERAITPADYAEHAQRFPGVQKAAAALRWTGSWYTVYLFVDREAGRPVDEAFKRRLLHYLEPYRLAGYDLEIRGPTFVPLDIALNVTVKPGFVASAVLAALAEALSSRDLANNQRGFFHPDNWSFGQPVYLSRLYQAALAVPGVATLHAQTFCRFGMVDAVAKERGVITIAPHEIACLGGAKGAPKQVAVQLTGRER